MYSLSLENFKNVVIFERGNFIFQYNFDDEPQATLRKSCTVQKRIKVLNINSFESALRNSLK